MDSFLRIDVVFGKIESIAFLLFEKLCLSKEEADMPKLKKSVRFSVLHNLGNEHFSAHDFNVSFPDKGSKLVEIVFLAIPSYSFVIEEYTEGNIYALAMGDSRDAKKAIRTVEVPGDYYHEEANDHDDITKAVDRVYEWVINLREDILHSKEKIEADTELNEMLNDLDKSIDEKSYGVHEYFSEAEKVEIFDQLDELKKRVQELEKQKGVDSSEINVIEQAIEKSKTEADQYPKVVWYKIAGKKLTGLFWNVMKNGEAQRLAADAVRRLMD